MRSSRLLTDAMVDRMTLTARSGAALSDIAWANGVSPDTLRNWRSVGADVISLVERGATLEAAAEALEVDAPFADRSRSLVLGIERARSDMRVRTLDRIAALGADVDAAAAPVQRGSLSALTFLLTRTSRDYSADRGPSAPGPTALPTGASSMTLSALQLRYDALPTGNSDGGLDNPLTMGNSDCIVDDALTMDNPLTLDNPSTEADDGPGAAAVQRGGAPVDRGGADEPPPTPPDGREHTGGRAGGGHLLPPHENSPVEIERVE